MSEVSKLHIQDFDGNQPIVPRDESKKVLDITRQRIGSLFDTHRPFVDRDTTDSGVQESLRLETIDPGTGDKTQFQLKRKADLPEGTTDPGEIRIEQESADGKGSLLSHTYSADDEGIVRRHDIDIGKIMEGDKFTTLQYSKTGEVTYAFKDPSSVANTMDDRIRVYNENRQIAREMGVNEQPVGKPEITSVFDVAALARVKEVTGRDLDNMIQARPKDLDRMDPGAILPEAQTAAEILRDGVRWLVGEVTGDPDKITDLKEVTEINGGEWTVFASQVLTDTGAIKPFVAARWKTENPDPTRTLVSTLQFEESGGYLLETKIDEVTDRGSYGISQTNYSSRTFPAGIKDARRVRNFLVDRKLK